MTSDHLIIILEPFMEGEVAVGQMDNLLTRGGEFPSFFIVRYQLFEVYNHLEVLGFL